MTLPEEHNLQAYRGDTFRQPFTMVTVTGEEINTDGWTEVKGELRRHPRPDVLVKALVISHAGSLVNISLPASDTAELEGQYVWDVQALIGADLKTVIRGSIYFMGDVTA